MAGMNFLGTGWTNTSLPAGLAKERKKIMLKYQKNVVRVLGEVVLTGKCTYAGPDRNPNGYKNPVAVMENLHVLSGDFPRVNRKDINLFEGNWADRDSFARFMAKADDRVGKTWKWVGTAFVYRRKNGTLDVGLADVRPAH